MIDTSGVKVKTGKMQIEVDDNRTPRGGVLQLSSRKDEQYMTPHSKQADLNSSTDRKPTSFVDRNDSRLQASNKDLSA